jgi:hypothetical protein
MVVPRRAFSQDAHPGFSTIAHCCELAQLLQGQYNGLCGSSMPFRPGCKLHKAIAQLDRSQRTLTVVGRYLQKCHYRLQILRDSLEVAIFKPRDLPHVYSGCHLELFS